MTKLFAQKNVCVLVFLVSLTGCSKAPEPATTTPVAAQSDSQATPTAEFVHPVDAVDAMDESLVPSNEINMSLHHDTTAIGVNWDVERAMLTDAVDGVGAMEPSSSSIELDLTPDSGNILPRE